MKIKTIYGFLLVALALTIGLFYACEKDNLNNELTGLEEKLLKFNEGKFPYQQGELLRGKTFIVQLPNDELGLIVNEKNAKSSVVYRLQTEGKVKLPEMITLEDAQVLFLQTSMLVNSVKSPFRLLVSIEEKRPTVLSEIKFDEEYLGYGLSRAKPNTRLTSVNPDVIISYLIKMCTCTCETRDDSNPSTCSSGGVGSTSCSVGGTSERACSTNCTSPKYACCNCPDE
jgi:hypothetical protein